MTVTISRALAAPQGVARQSWTNALVAGLNRWWAAYRTRRIEQAAIDQLWSMSDRQLRDIGLTRSEIESAVQGKMRPDRGSRRIR